MKLVYGDFETYYDKEYTLRSMTPYEYILDPRWETIGCGIAFGDNKPIFYPGDEVATLLQEYPHPWAFVSYNALFDASILSFRYNIHPDLLIDPMGIVRATLLHKLPHGRVSLAKVTEFLSLPSKDVNALVPGYHRVDYERSGAITRLAEYCLQDVDSMRSIMKILGKSFPRQELWVMSTIIKMCTRCNFYTDIVKLSQHYLDVVNAKETLLQRVGLTKSDLLSNDKFVNALRQLGVDPPTKISPATGNVTYACAKSDLNYLLEYPMPDVQALVAARVGIKSTLEEARTQRFIGINETSMRVYDKPWMPIPLAYGAAHTHRFGGEWAINMQNLPTRKSNKLREALIAPPDHVILAVDAAQIECRLTAWLAEETELLEQFARGVDVYAWFGSDMFKRVITKEKDPIERFISKENVLGLGFQMGPEKLLTHLTNKAADMGLNITFTLGQCEVWVNYYRTRFKKIRNLWWTTQKILDQLTFPNPPSFKMGPSFTDGTDLVLPTGLRLFYDNIHHRDGETIFDYGRERERWDENRFIGGKKIYGGKFTENHVQALDRCHVMDAAYRIEQRFPLVPLAHQVHDELIYVPHKSQAATLGVIAYEEMKTPCWWGSSTSSLGLLPLDAEIKIGKSYGEMKPVKLSELKEII